MTIKERYVEVSMSELKPVLAILGGTGKEGPGLAMRWGRAGYRIIIGSRQLEKAQATARQLSEILSLNSIVGLENSQAARTADICILTVVSTAHQTALESLKDDLQGKILVDATARVDFRNPKPPPAPSPPPRSSPRAPGPRTPQSDRS